MPSPTAKKEASAKPKRRLSKKRLILLSILTVFVLGSGTALGIVLSIAAKAPQFNPRILTNTDQSSIIYDKDGNQIGVIHATQNREDATSKQIDANPLIKKAFVAVEDTRFYDHIGIDPIGIARALYADLTGKKLQGASTITIQLARGAFLSPDKTLTRKIQEAALALKLERLYTKDEILTMYLNRIYFGESAYGIKAAAQTYFGKPLDKLDMGDIAMLAGLPQAPSAYDPYENPDKAKYRRTVVLGVLRDDKIISQADYDKYKDAPFSYVDKMKEENKNPQAGNLPNVQVSYKYPGFVSYVIHELEDRYNISPDAIFSGGLKIYTTVDSKIQQAAESAYADPKNFPKDVYGKPVQSAMVVMDPNDGSIRAMIGGRNYTSAMDFNRAWQALRQPGSSAKPLTVYAPALAKGGYFPGTVLDNMPVQYKGADGKIWAPVNFDTPSAGWTGMMTMREAVRNSVNVYAVRLLDKIGIDYGWQFAKDQFGLPLGDRDKVLSLALGSESVSVLDMVSAYTAFPSGGLLPERHSVVKVLDKNGASLVDNTNVEKKRILTPQVAYVMTDMLHTVATSGTGTNAQFGNPKWAVAGKTGTTSLDDNKVGQGLRDAWFMGFTPDYAGGVWMGLDQSDSKYHLTSDTYGGDKPAKLWKKIMEVAHQGLPVKTQFDRPSGISTITYDTESGLAPSSLTPPQFISHDIAISGALPTGTSNVWVQMDVCAVTGLLPGPNTTQTVSKVFLNITRTGPAANIPWPAKEAPYKPPTEVCNMPPSGPANPGTGSTPDPGTNPPPAENPLSNLSVKVQGSSALLSFNLAVPANLKIDATGPNGPLKTYTVPATSAGGYNSLPIALPTITTPPPKPKVIVLPGKYVFTVTAIDPNEPDQVLGTISKEITVP